MTYTTVQGDKWDSIAYKQLGSCDYVESLMKLNPTHVRTYIFDAGIVLTLPEKSEEVTVITPPWKRGKRE